jgi:hypothetical protein
MKYKHKNQTKNLIGGAVGLLAGTALLGAAAAPVAGMETGMAKTMAGTAVGLGGVALVGHSLGMIPKDFGFKPVKMKRVSRKKRR